MNEKESALLPESVRDWNEVKEAKDLNSFWDGMKSLRSKIGTGLYQPGKDAGTEDWDKFNAKAVELSNGKLMPKIDFDNPDQSKALFKSLGVPDDEKDYEFAEIEGYEVDEDRNTFIRKIAKEANLTKKQLKVIDQRYREEDMKFATASKESFDNDLQELKSEWGLPTLDRINSAKKVQEIFFPHIPKGTNLSAAEIKSFYSLYKQLNTDTSEFQDQHHEDKGGLSKEDAALKISEVRNNKDHPYNNPRDPGFKAAKKMMRNLYLAKNGEAPN